MSKHACSDHGFVVRVKKGEMTTTGTRTKCVACDAAAAYAACELGHWAIKRAAKLEEKARMLRSFAEGADPEAAP